MFWLQRFPRSKLPSAMPIDASVHCCNIGLNQYRGCCMRTLLYIANLVSYMSYEMPSATRFCSLAALSPVQRCQTACAVKCLQQL